MKHEMLKEAQKQIDLVTKIEKMDDQAGHLSRMAQELEIVVQRKQKETLLAKKKVLERLNIRNLPPVAPNPQFAAAPTIPSVPLDAEGRPMRQLEPLPTVQKHSNVALVDFEEDVEPEPLVARREKPAWVTNRQLDRETRLMPAGTVSFYKRHIEPKIIENCIACHDSRSHSMPLSKRSFGQTIPRRMSQQNLHFVVEQVNRTAPFESRLLQMATTAHGEQKLASFKMDDPALFDLKKWVVAISDDPAKWLMQLSEESIQEVAQAQTSSDPPTQSQAGVTVAPVAKGPADEPQQLTAELNKAEVVETELEQSDPYDPAGFNRK